MVTKAFGYLILIRGFYRITGYGIRVLSIYVCYYSYCSHIIKRNNFVARRAATVVHLKRNNYGGEKLKKKIKKIYINKKPNEIHSTRYHSAKHGRYH